MAKWRRSQWKGLRQRARWNAADLEADWQISPRLRCGKRLWHCPAYLIDLHFLSCTAQWVHISLSPIFFFFFFFSLQKKELISVYRPHTTLSVLAHPLNSSLMECSSCTSSAALSSPPFAFFSFLQLPSFPVPLISPTAPLSSVFRPLGNPTILVLSDT